ncbi:hypothetical protein BC937DRAFT_94365 [Endogone sp. FLAS-F59071]|nr:hypothetical protein BC937DRAFT_94365 [Endogone sp. FLAS-F59071]|eukprot:RUS20799.1 hypothetical protein BC937DRAFT_94365 [Endogone sp. FLAS-F59071]
MISILTRVSSRVSSPIKSNGQSGLPSLMAPHAGKSQKELDEYLEKAKCFYYSRFVQPVDYSALVAWRGQQNQISEPEESGRWQQEQPETPTAAATEDITMASSSISPLSILELNSDRLVLPFKNPVLDDSTSAVAPPSVGEKLSFAQLVDMINKGEPIPGIKQIPNKLNEGTPSVPSQPRRQKPWEIKKEETPKDAEEDQGDDSEKERSA